MLQRQLIVRLGVLVMGFVSGSVVAILLMQSVLRQLDDAAAHAAAVSTEVAVVNLGIDEAEASVLAGSGIAPDLLREISSAALRLAPHIEVPPESPGAAAFDDLAGHCEHLASIVGDDSRDSVPEPALVAALGAIRLDVRQLSEASSQQAAAGILAVSTDLRRLIVGLCIAALVMANIAVVILVRTGRLILRPVSALVAGSRELAAEHFDHRVSVDRDDEFGELARAYNHLAAELQGNEERRIETLRQLAVTLNHEINNVISIIELQLGLLDRRTGGDSALAGHLLRIRGALHRIALTIASLKDLRRIVVTDYGPGQKMLDLARSTEEAPTIGARTAKPAEKRSGDRGG